MNADLSYAYMAMTVSNLDWLLETEDERAFDMEMAIDGLICVPVWYPGEVVKAMRELVSS